ncbi:MAG: type II toxin-antitoxin system VapC family toxin [Chloroflexaceae bacterium]
MRKTFRNIPDSATVLLDANIVVYALYPQSQFHTACAHLLERGALQEVTLHLVVNVAAEIIYRTMVLELLNQGTLSHASDAVMYLKRNPQIVQQLTRYKTVLRDLKQARINILPLTYRDLHASRHYRETYVLLTNDSLIMAAMQRERITYLATNDADFTRIPGIAIRVPD